MKHLMEDHMQRTSQAWKQVPVMALLVLGSGIVYAQGPGAQVMTAERSWQIQSTLQSIDADRESWVNLLVSKWAAVLDPIAYNPSNELGSAARMAPAWQLYGAYLANDYMTANQILRGQRGAGPYIAGQVAGGGGEAQAQFGPTPLALGSGTDSQVYTPISPPCRVLDTRNAGARTTALASNETRTFDLTAEAETEGQGGTFPCGNLPSTHHIGWAVNITVVGVYRTHGGLKAWPFTGPEPAISVINWTPGMNGAIANGVTITGCSGCADSINIKNFGTDSTHVIIDVMGFFGPASANNAAVTRFAGTAVNVAAGAGATAFGAACPAGTLLVGGDLEHPSTGAMAISASGEVFIPSRGPNVWHWQFKMFNATGGSVTVAPYSRCVDTPVKFN
jgi:hypothetical protein